MKVVGYIRVSTDQQADSGLSLESQKAKIEAMAVVKGWDDVEILVDTVSAKDLNRPAMQDLMARAKAGKIGAVVIAKLDRLTRSVRDVAELVQLFNKKNVALVSVAETLDTASANGRMIMNVLAVFAQFEREIIAERTADAMRVKKHRGEPTSGNPPYGYLLEGKTLVPVAEEQRVIGLIQEWRKLGKSLRAIAEELNGAGLRTRAGGEWVLQYVANVLRRSA